MQFDSRVGVVKEQVFPFREQKGQIRQGGVNMKLRVFLIRETQTSKQQYIDVEIPKESTEYHAQVKWADYIHRGIYDPARKRFYAPSQIKSAEIVEG